MAIPTDMAILIGDSQPTPDVGEGASSSTQDAGTAGLALLDGISPWAYVRFLERACHLALHRSGELRRAPARRRRADAASLSGSSSPAQGCRLSARRAGGE